MKTTALKIVVSVTFFAVAYSSGAILPPNRCVDWSGAGIPGGIPSANWPVFRTLSLSSQRGA